MSLTRRPPPPAAAALRASEPESAFWIRRFLRRGRPAQSPPHPQACSGALPPRCCSLGLWSLRSSSCLSFINPFRLAESYASPSEKTHSRDNLSIRRPLMRETRRDFVMAMAAAAGFLAAEDAWPFAPYPPTPPPAHPRRLPQGSFVPLC